MSVHVSLTMSIYYVLLTVSVRCTCFADDVCVCRTLVSNTANMHAFAYNAVEYLHRYNFDGLDVDWEFPADRGSPAGDKQRFTDLLKVTIVYFSLSLSLSPERLMYLIFKVLGSYRGQNLTSAGDNNKR